MHLRNCTRCVEHERRLVQATDSLLAGVAPLSGRPGAALGPTALVPVGEDPVPEDERTAEGETLQEAAPAPSSAQIAAAAEVLVTARTRRQLATAVTWNVMIAIALILTIATIALIVAGILGAHL